MKTTIQDENDPDQVDMLDLLNLKRDAFGQTYEYKPENRYPVKSVIGKTYNKTERDHIGD